MTEVAPVAEHRTESARAEERAHTSVREYIESLLVTVILALFGTTFVVQAFKIPSQSMEPTLLVADHLLVTNLSLAAGIPGMKSSCPIGRFAGAT